MDKRLDLRRLDLILSVGYTCVTLNGQEGEDSLACLVLVSSLNLRRDYLKKTS
jgi:hypothetical protein